MFEYFHHLFDGSCMDIIGTSFMLIVAESGKVNLVTCFFVLSFCSQNAGKEVAAPPKAKSEKKKPPPKKEVAKASESEEEDDEDEDDDDDDEEEEEPEDDDEGLLTTVIDLNRIRKIVNFNLVMRRRKHFFFVLSQAWVKENSLSPNEESNL